MSEKRINELCREAKKLLMSHGGMSIRLEEINSELQNLGYSLEGISAANDARFEKAKTLEENKLRIVV